MLIVMCTCIYVIVLGCVHACIPPAVGLFLESALHICHIFAQILSALSVARHQIMYRGT